VKVFHGIVEIAGQMGALCGGLKSQGHIAVGYNTFHSYLAYKNHLINTGATEIRDSFKHILNFFDIFHYHYGVPIWENMRDLSFIRNKGKKIVMHHWGNDVRFHHQAKLNNPYVYTGDSPPNEIIHKNLTQLSKYIKEAIVQDYEVLPYVKPYYNKVHVLPLAIDLSRFGPSYPELQKKSRPLILHAPTNPDFKGTAYIERAIEKLKSTHKFDYRRIEKMSYAKAVNLYRKADIIVDQIRCGAYGMFSVESMALGKPVIAYIRPDLVAKFPHYLPILNANPNNIQQKIEMLLDTPSLRLDLGIEGRSYIMKHHSREVVIEKLLNIYSQLS
jgi:glycosyltransferase involved in cell wall biosynthesis